MKSSNSQLLKDKAPLLLVILFEVIAGILLLINPRAVTRAVIIIIGIAGLIVGAVYLLSYFSDKKKLGTGNQSNLIVGIIALVIGIFCAFFSGWIVSLFKMIAVFYGIILIISGIFKIKAYYDKKKDGIPGDSSTLIISAVISIVLGIIIFFLSVDAVWIVLGITLLVEAAVDIIGLVTAKK